MSLRKRCSLAVRPYRADRETDLLDCPKSPRCPHPWYYDFRVNGRRYRASTETSDKHRARDIEARERARILAGRHGIRRQPDITFREFARVYLRDHAELHKRSVERDREIIKTLDRFFGSVLLHELTAHRIEQFKRDRLQGTWRAHKQRQRRAQPVRPATVNRELDTLKSILSKAVEWGRLVESPARHIKRLRIDNRRTRILSMDEQRRLLQACQGKIRAIVAMALFTGARIGELLTLRWDQCDQREIVFLNTKNGKVRRLPMSPTLRAILQEQPQVTDYVFANPRTQEPYTAITASFRRALARAKIDAAEVTVHTLRHTALSRMIAAGYDDYTVMEISGHSSTRMLARYMHPTTDRKIAALEDGFVVTQWSQWPDLGHAPGSHRHGKAPVSVRRTRVRGGGPHGTRTHDLRVANAALSQLS